MLRFNKKQQKGISSLYAMSSIHHGTNIVALLNISDFDPKAMQTLFLQASKQITLLKEDVCIIMFNLYNVYVYFNFLLFVDR